MTTIPHSRPWLAEEDLAAVSRVLGTEMLAQGETCRAFEDALSAWVGGSAGGVATASGSAALVLSLMALGIGDDDEVVIPTYVCPSVLEAVRTTGARPVLCDVGDDWVMTPQEVERVLTQRTRAIVVIHLYGLFADVAGFARFGVPVIEDCAQALGDRGERAVEGAVGVFSFHPTKCLTTGEGGMAVSTDRALVERLRLLRDGQADAGGARLFSPLSDLAAGLGLSQLARYSKGLARRRLLLQRYREALEPVIPEGVRSDALDGSMGYRFPVHVPGGLESCRDAFAARGVTVRRGVDHLLHRMMGMPDASFPRSTRHFETTVSLPIYPALTDAEHERCVDAAVTVLAGRAKAKGRKCHNFGEEAF